MIANAGMDAVSAAVPSFTRTLFKEELHVISHGIARCRKADDVPSTVSSVYGVFRALRVRRGGEEDGEHSNEK